jgi:hypothetical protein
MSLNGPRLRQRAMPENLVEEVHRFCRINR